MGNDLERTAEQHLTSSLTRRDTLMRGAGIGLAATLRGVIPTHASASEEDVPEVLSDSYTSDPEQINHGGTVTVAVEAVNDKDGNTFAVYSLFSNGTVGKVDYSPVHGKYELSDEATAVPMKVVKSMVGFANHESQGNELLVVGGHNTSEDLYTKYATLALSNDSGRSFEPFPLLNERNEQIEGIVREMKRIPYNDKVLLLIGQERTIEHQYGLFDINTNKFSLITGEFDELPHLDDLFVHPDNPSTMLGCGRVTRRDEQGTTYTGAINDFVLDLDNAVVHSSTTHYDNLPYLDDVQVVRDEKGNRETTYALQSFAQGEMIMARNVFKLDPNVDEANPAGFGYGPLDMRLIDAMDKSQYLNREYIKHGVSVFLKNIHVVPHGTWVTSLYKTISGQRPFAAYWQPDKDSLPDDTTLKVYPFDMIRVFPTEIEQQPELASFLGRNKIWDKSPGSDYGLLLGLQAGGVALIQTDENFYPLDAAVLYQEKLEK